MRVYRYLTEEELNNILGDRCDNIGGKYYGMQNSFRYDKKSRYIHFFKNLSDIQYIRALKKWRIERGDYLPTDFYICEFNIPAIILMLSEGEGVYCVSDSQPNGIKVKEFAIKNSIFKSRWMNRYVKDDINIQFDTTAITNRLNGNRQNVSEKTPTNKSINTPIK